MASQVEICNRALQKLGAKRIAAITEDSVNGRACNLAYTAVLESELQDHPWSFAIERFALSADATAPAWGRARSFTLPSNHLRLCAPYPEDNYAERDWIIEGNKILTD